METYQARIRTQKSTHQHARHVLLIFCAAGKLATESDVGRRVRVQGYACGGVLRFYGSHATKNIPRCGVELDEPVGKNDGTVGGHVYFKCADSRGVLVAPSKVMLE